MSSGSPFNEAGEPIMSAADWRLEQELDQQQQAEAAEEEWWENEDRGFHEEDIEDEEQEDDEDEEQEEDEKTAVIHETPEGFQIHADLEGGQISNGATFVTRDRAKEAIQLAGMTERQDDDESQE